MFKLVAILSSLVLATTRVQAYTCSCNGRSYTNTDIFGAVNKGYSIDQAANQPNGLFPHRYTNPNSVSYPWCTAAGAHLAEYPLLTVPPGPYDVTTAGGPGPDRAIYLVGRARTFCGCMTQAVYPGNAEDLVLCQNDD